MQGLGGTHCPRLTLQLQIVGVASRPYETIPDGDIVNQSQQPVLSARSLYEQITEANSWQPSVESCIPWLEEMGLTRKCESYQPATTEDGTSLLEMGNRLQAGIPCHRAERKNKSQLDMLRRNKEKESEEVWVPSPESLQHIWNEYKSPREKILALDITRMPADALAFYQPFHFSPFGEWGIYILVGRLLHQWKRLYESFQGKLYAFTPETLLGCVLFETFHHEFFHHLVECTATTIEILSAGFGPVRPIYLRYWDHGYEKEPSLGEHPHNPLEEALANAYAYNSFSFLSRVGVGYRTVLTRLYQEILKKCWAQEGPGYRNAGDYIGPRYVAGAGQLLAMLLSCGSLDPNSLVLLSRSVMPGGHSAFVHKAHIPTYLVGSKESLRVFSKLVPAPNETYTSLFWLLDTDPIDNFLRAQKKLEKKSKSPSK